MTIGKRLKELNHDRVIAAILMVAMVLNTLTISLEFVRTGHVQSATLAWQAYIALGLVWVAWKL